MTFVYVSLIAMLVFPSFVMLRGGKAASLFAAGTLSLTVFFVFTLFWWILWKFFGGVPQTFEQAIDAGRWSVIFPVFSETQTNSLTYYTIFVFAMTLVCALLTLQKWCGSLVGWWWMNLLFWVTQVAIFMRLGLEILGRQTFQQLGLENLDEVKAGLGLVLFFCFGVSISVSSSLTISADYGRRKRAGLPSGVGEGPYVKLDGDR